MITTATVTIKLSKTETTTTTTTTTPSKTTATTQHWQHWQEQDTKEMQSLVVNASTGDWLDSDAQPVFTRGRSQHRR